MPYLIFIYSFSLILFPVICSFVTSSLLLHHCSSPFYPLSLLMHPPEIPCHLPSLSLSFFACLSFLPRSVPRLPAPFRHFILPLTLDRKLPQTHGLPLVSFEMRAQPFSIQSLSSNSPFLLSTTGGIEILKKDQLAEIKHCQISIFPSLWKSD